jgi:hypothetical protein
MLAVDADGGNVAFPDEELRRFQSEGREVELARVARRIVAEVALAVGIPVAPTRAQQHDRARCDLRVRFFPSLDVRHSETVIGVHVSLRRHVRDDRRCDKLVERHRRRRVAAFGKMHRRIQVGPAVLRSTEGGRAVEPAALRLSCGKHLMLEPAWRCWPIERSCRRCE